MIVADIGSGTGKLSKLFLDSGHSVMGVEPSAEMRKAAEKELQSYHKFGSISGIAEKSSLHNKSVDLIVCGQSFHWFDRVKAKIEFKRIAKRNTYAILVWNERQETSQFMTDYENILIKYSTDYENVDHRNLDEADYRDFYGPAGYELKSFKNEQTLDFTGLEGRLNSSSYMIKPNHSKYQKMLKDLNVIYDEHQIEGMVKFDYKTQLYYGKIK